MRARARSDSTYRRGRARARSRERRTRACLVRPAYWTRGVGCDPLACEYAALFPAWQPRAQTITAKGGGDSLRRLDLRRCALRQRSGSRRRPVGICARVGARRRARRPRLLHCQTSTTQSTLGPRTARAWKRGGPSLRIRPVRGSHRTPHARRRARGFNGLPLRALEERHDEEDARALARRRPPRHAGDRLKNSSSRTRSTNSSPNAFDCGMRIRAVARP